MESREFRRAVVVAIAGLDAARNDIGVGPPGSSQYQRLRGPQRQLRIARMALL
jgi:hypothetical protein